MATPNGTPAFLFDLDGTLVDSVYQHVLAWREALERGGRSLAVWQIHRRIGMSGGLLVNALARETGGAVEASDAEQLIHWHAEAYLKYVEQVRPPLQIDDVRQDGSDAARALVHRENECEKRLYPKA